LSNISSSQIDGDLILSENSTVTVLENATVSVTGCVNIAPSSRLSVLTNLSALKDEKGDIIVPVFGGTPCVRGDFASVSVGSTSNEDICETPIGAEYKQGLSVVFKMYYDNCINDSAILGLYVPLVLLCVLQEGI
jgi:hypothetical protein